MGFVMKSRNIRRLIREPIESIGENEEGGRPESNEDSKPFGMGLLHGILLAIEKPPGRYRKNYGEQTCLKTDGAEDATDFGIHYRYCVGDSTYALLSQ